MNKRLHTLLLVAIAAGVFSILLVVSTAKDEVVYVDNNKILANSKKAADAKLVLQGKIERWSANLDTLWSELQSYEKKLKEEANTLSSKEKELNLELLTTKRKQFAQYRDAIEQKTREEDQKVTQQVLQEINAFIQDYARQKDYQLILGATGAGNIVFADKGMDITDEVIAALNESHEN